MKSFVEVKEVDKSYVQGEQSIQVLTQLNLDIKAGETIAIIGQSGSGKSTLLSLLAGLDRPDKGQIMIHENDITAMDEYQLASFRGKAMGIVFQQFHLMSHLTAMENIALPLEIKGVPNGTEESLLALEQVGLLHRKDHFPHQLSGGERQRVAIARAFVTRPSILLADEPSGNLDTQTGRQVMDLLFKLVSTHQMTMILVTHNESLAQRCHRCFRLEAGQLKEES